MQARIDAVVLEQLLVRALLHYAVPCQHHDAVGMSDGGEAVGDHQRGAAVRELGERLLDRCLRCRVEG